MELFNSALFASQFTTPLTTERLEGLTRKQHVIVCGMGGSHLAAWLIKNYGGYPELSIHRDYGLPVYMHDSALYRPEDTLVVLSSYSGTTEEVLDAGAEALRRGCAIACITTGGALATFARDHGLPLVLMPEIGLEPRLALGLATRALATVLQDSSLEESIVHAGAGDFVPHEADTDRLFKHILGHVPLIWASQHNAPLAYIWKVNFNETSKTPAFIDVCPELCHNDLCGFDVTEDTRPITSAVAIVQLFDTNDHVRVQKRMHIAEQTLREKGLSILTQDMQGGGWYNAFRMSVLGDVTARMLAEQYHVPYPQTPLIAEFKRRMSS